jgi:hypothetical protein
MTDSLWVETVGVVASDDNLHFHRLTAGNFAENDVELSAYGKAGNQSKK